MAGDYPDDTLQSTPYEYHPCMTKIQVARPILKWAGGKQGSAKTIVELFPTSFETFYEPFLGGASVLLTVGARRSVASDLNRWVIDTYIQVREDWRAVARVLDEIPNTKEEFLRVRAVQPDTLDAVSRAAHLVYLNKTCFRGLFRVNRRGMFNVPYGAYSRRYYSEENFEAFSSAVSNTTFRCDDFEQSLDGITKRDFAYLDPPYYKLGGYSDFNRYTRGQFCAPDHIRLAAVCRELDRSGVRWALSNSNTPFVRRLFDGYQFNEIDNRREINLNSRARSIKELVITNY